MSEINWKVAKDDAQAIYAIVKRAEREWEGLSPDRTMLMMDITAAHANGCPLDLAGLLIAEPFDFAHDIAGITAHIDRETGRLMNCFLPRYATKGSDGDAS